MLFSLALLSSCNTSKEIIYFQDVEVNSPEAVAPPQDITVQPKDQISIVVSSKDPELAALFNLTRVQQRVGSTGLNNSNNNGEISGYTLDDKGAIDFPVLGNLTVGGHDPKPDCRIGKTKTEGGELGERPGGHRGVYEPQLLRPG